MTEDKEEKRITLRVSPETYKVIQTLAKAQNMSINGYIIQAIANAEFDKILERRMTQIEEEIRELKKQKGETE